MLQQRIAKSRIAIPLMILYSTFLWSMLLISDISHWPATILFVINLLLISELNNRNALNRQHNRKICCIYIALMSMCVDVMTNTLAMAIQSCLLASLILLFQTYQRREDMTHRYGSYLFLGIAISLWPPLLFIVPLFWLCEAIYLMSFSIRAWGASILGLLTPLWFVLPYVIYYSRFDIITERIGKILPNSEMINMLTNTSTSIQLHLPEFESIATLIILMLILIISITHYLKHSYNDKIQVRMLHHFLIVIVIIAAIPFIAITLFTPDTPHAKAYLTSMLIAAASPVTTQYVTTTTSRIAAVTIIIFFVLSIILAVNSI